jgi:hypothetical protein
MLKVMSLIISPCHACPFTKEKDTEGNTKAIKVPVKGFCVKFLVTGGWRNRAAKCR